MDVPVSAHDSAAKFVLALTIHLMLVGLLVALFLRAVPPENHDAFIIVLGVVSGGCTTIWAYFFGSSSGSARKDATNAMLAATAAAVTTTPGGPNAPNDRSDLPDSPAPPAGGQ